METHHIPGCLRAVTVIQERVVYKRCFSKSSCSLDSILFTLFSLPESTCCIKSFISSNSLWIFLNLLPLISWKYSFPFSVGVLSLSGKTKSLFSESEDILCLTKSSICGDSSFTVSPLIWLIRRMPNKMTVS